MPALVADVLSLVFSELTRADLASCCLVERSWTPFAKKELYRHQAFDEYEDFHAFEKSIRLHPHLRPLAKSLQLYLAAEPRHPEAPRSVERDDLVSILGLTKGHLDRLNLWALATLGGEDGGVQEAMGGLRSLRSLSLSTGNASEIGSYDGAVFASLMEGWKELSVLSLTGLTFEPHDWTSRATSCKAQLTSVNLFGVVITDEELKWLLSSSGKSLTTFRHIEIPVTPFSSILATLRSGFEGLPPRRSSVGEEGRLWRVE